jgi:iron only hydrogenase large subunit-like protein
VAAAVAQALKERGSEIEAKCIACAGLDQCRTALLKLDKGLVQENFIEGMACALGGCIQSPAVLVRSPKNKAELNKYIDQAQGKTIGAAVQKAEG